jgi:hypothetical protein
MLIAGTSFLAMRLGGCVGAATSTLSSPGPSPPPVASLSSLAKYVSVASFDAQSLCWAIIGETRCTCSFDSEAISGVITSALWYSFRTLLITLYASREVGVYAPGSNISEGRRRLYSVGESAMLED